MAFRISKLAPALALAGTLTLAAIAESPAPALANGLPSTSIQQGQGFMSGMPSAPNPAAGAQLRAAGVPVSSAYATPKPASYPGGLGVDVLPGDSARAGGRGTGFVEVFQRESPGINARDVRLTLRAQKGLRIASAVGDGWLCTARGSTASCRGRDVTRKVAPGVLRVNLRASKLMKPNQRRLYASLSWRERRDANMVAAGLSKPAPRGSRDAQLVRRTMRDFGDIPTDRLLGVSLKLAGPRTQPTGDPGMTTVLRASISNIQGTQVNTRWSQLCTTAQSARTEELCGGRIDPRARFLEDAANPKATKIETMGIDLPDVKATTELAFRVEAANGGYTARDTSVVIARPFREAILNPRLSTLRRIDELATPVPKEKQVGRSQRVITGSISGSNVADVVAGRARKLTVRAGSRRIVSARWSVVRGDKRLLAGAKRRGRSITIRPGRALGARAFVLRADVRLKGGDRLQLAKTVKVLPRGRRASASLNYGGLSSPRLRAGLASHRRQAAAVSDRVDARVAKVTGQPVARAAAGTPEKTLCAVADVVKQNKLQPLPYPSGPMPLDPSGRPITPIDGDKTPDIVLGGGAMLWLGEGVKLSAGSCDAGTKISFSGAQMSVGDNTFINVKGEITSAGLVISSGAYRIPAEWATRIPSVRDELSKGIRFTVPSASRVRSNLDPKSGEWGTLGGEIDLPTGIELLKLPGGWKFKPARLGLETTGLVSLSIEAVAPAGEQATGGSVLIEGRMDPLGQAELEVTASNVATIRQANGDQVAFSGGGLLTFTQAFDQCEYDPATGLLKDPACDTNSEGNSLTVTPQVWVEAAGQVRLADNFALTKARMLWSPERFEAEMAARAGSEKSFVDFAVNGSYASTEDWNFGISAKSDNWEVVNGLVVERLEGTVTRTRPDAEKPGITTIYARAGARGWKPSPAFEVSSLDAALTNECPKTGDAAKECQTGAVRLNLDVKGKAQLPIDGVNALDWESVASVNLSTLKFTLYGGVKIPDGGIGPEGLKLREIKINLSNEANVGVCVPRGPPVTPATAKPVAQLAADQRLNFSLIAKGTVLGKEANFVGEVGNGLCLIGDLRGGMPADAPYSDSYGGELKVAYSSFDATFSDGGLQYTLDAKRVQLATTFALPAVVKDTLKLSGVGRFVASVGAARDRNGKPTTGNSFDAKISIEMEKGAEPVIFGERSGSHLGLDTAYLRLVWGGGATSFTAGTQATYRTQVAAQAEGAVSESQTPFFLSATFDKSGATVAGGVDPARSPDKNAKGESVVNNAFGVQEMKVYGLSVSLTLGLNNSLGFRADTVLPARWVEPIGIKDGARIALAASVSKTNPCFEFSITNEKGKEEVAVDVANAGLLSANELNLLLAPSGCVVGDKTIKPGFGFKFNGRIAGAFPLQVEANVQLPSREAPTRFYLEAKLQVPSFEFGTVAQFEKTDFELKIDPANQDYLVRLNGGVNVLGQRVSVAANFQSTGGLGNVKLDGRVETNLGVVGFNLDSKLAIKLDMANYDIKTFGFDADMRLKVLGTTLAGAKAELLYNNRVVEKFNFELTAGINVGVAAAQGTVRVNYNLLRPNGQTTGAFTEKDFRVGFGGKLRFLFWSTGFDWNIYSWRGPLDKTDVDAQRSLKDGGSEQGDVDRAPALPLVRVKENSGLGAATYGRVTGLTYKTSYNVQSPNAVQDKASSDQRGDLLVTVCSIDKPNAGGTCAAQERKLTAVLDYPNKTVTVLDATTIWQQRWRDSYVLKGADWTGIVKWIEASRAEYKKKTGRDLPPMRTWSAQAPTAVGQVSYGDTLTTDIPDARRKLNDRDLLWSFSAGLSNTPRADGTLKWGRAFRYASSDASARNLVAGTPPGRTIPLVSDFDGDGYDDLAQFIAPLSPEFKPIFRIRGASGRTTTIQRGSCAVLSYCQPVEPLGTPFNPTGSGKPFDGSDGAMYPVTGEWDISAGAQDLSVDDVGVATIGANSPGQYLRWELWPQAAETVRFTLGARQGAGVVDQPVTGDWNGDGITDVGVFRPAAAVGQAGRWYLFDLARIRQLLRERKLDADQIIDVNSADWKVELGQYGDMPVTGDWNGDGRAGVGVVSYGDRALGSASPEWKLQDFVETTCGSEACVPEHVFRYGSYNAYPIAGRWTP